MAQTAVANCSRVSKTSATCCRSRKERQSPISARGLRTCPRRCAPTLQSDAAMPTSWLQRLLSLLTFLRRQHEHRPRRCWGAGGVRVLIGCERSRKVASTFERRGHEVLSCDLEPQRQPGAHYVGNVLDVIDYPWDFGGFH